MANSTVNLFSDYATEQKALERKRKMADTLVQQSLEPLVTNQTAGGYVIPVSKYAGLAKLLQAGTGAYFNKKVDDQEKELNQRYRSEGNDALIKGMELMRGKAAQPEIPNPPDEIGGGPGRAAQPAVVPDMQGAAAAFGAHPLTQPYSAALFAQALKANDPYTLAPDATRMVGDKPIAVGKPRTMADNRPELVHLQETASNLLPTDPGYEQIQARIKKLTSIPQEEKGTWGDPYVLNGSVVQKNTATGQIRQAVSREPQVHVINPPAVTTDSVIDPNDASRVLRINARIYNGGSLGAAGVLGVAPKLSDAQKLVNKREFNMQGIGATIKTAEDLLTGSTGKDLPTGSTVGNIADVVGGVFGMSPTGAKEAETLKAVGGALVSKMPRMEGPQSDKDVQLYKEMAARVGDPTVPRDRRIAALEQVKELWSKYERLNPGAFAGGGASSGAGGGWSVVK